MTDFPTAENSSVAAAATALFKDKRVLLIDDQRSFQVMMKATLMNIGLNRVTLLTSAEEGRRRCQKEQFDIYLIDYNLGMGENGRQLLNHLRENKLLPADATVFVISGDNSRSMVLSALESEPDDYLMKPFSQEQLRQRLQRALLRKQELKEVFIALANDDPAEVIKSCEQVLGNGTRFGNYCRCLMADMHMKMGDAAEARHILRSGLAAGESSWLRLGLGKACQMLDLHEEAITHLNAALQLRPLMVEAYRWLAISQLATGFGPEAIETLTRATEISAQSGILHRQLAEISLAQGDYRKARESLATMIELNRFATERNPQLIGSYVHCLILHAMNSDDPFHIGNLQKQVNSALYRCRQALLETDFDYNSFEQICQARVQMARGDLIRGKRMLYKVGHNYGDEPSQMDTPLLSSMVLALFTIRALGVPTKQVLRVIQNTRKERYASLRGYFRGSSAEPEEEERIRLKSITLLDGMKSVGQSIDALDLPSRLVEATMVRRGKEKLDTQPDLVLQTGDVLVLRGTADCLAQAEEAILG